MRDADRYTGETRPDHRYRRRKTDRSAHGARINHNLTKRRQQTQRKATHPMPTTIKMPQLGESVTEGTIERWLVKEGDTVEQYDPLFEVVTDKVNAEVPAEIAGKVTKIIVPDGETVSVGTPVAEIDADGAGVEAASEAATPEAAAPAAPEEPAQPAQADDTSGTDAGQQAVAQQEQAPSTAQPGPAAEPQPQPEPQPEPEPEPAAQPEAAQAPAQPPAAEAAPSG